MTVTRATADRHALADQLAAAGVLRSPEWRAAVESVPRELFLQPGVFLPTGDGRWRPVTAADSEPDVWLALAHRDEPLVTQLDGHLTADQATGPVTGLPTSSSTAPAVVVAMLEALQLSAGQTVLEIGTGTGYSTALLCHRLGADGVTSIEVDPVIGARADAALQQAGFSTWTVVGDGLLGHPPRAPYDRTVATVSVRRLPLAWLRQSAPGGAVLGTIGTWSHGSGLARVSVTDAGSARGSIIGRSTFMPARSQAVLPAAGDLASRTAFADTERRALVRPEALDEWMPAFLAQLSAPGAQLVPAVVDDGRGTRLLHLVDPERESFAELREDGEGWRVRQGGPVALWDGVERSLLAWQRAGRPEIEAVQVRITDRSHAYWIDGEPALRWEHRVA